jgi:hypothetical protein
MAIVFWVGASANSNTVTLPAGAAEGMFALVQAFRADSATAPSLPAGWSAIGTNAIGATTKSERTGYKVLTAADITAGNIGTWTNAQRVIVAVYHSNSGFNIEYVSGQAQEGDSTTNLQIYTMTAGCSMVVCLGHSTSSTIRNKSFTNFVNRSAAFTALSAMCVDSDGIIGNTANNSLTPTGDDWVSRRINLVEIPVIEFDAITTSSNATMSLTGANTSSTVFAITARVANVSPTIPAAFTNLGTISAATFWAGSLVTKRLTPAEITAGSIAGFTNSTTMVAVFYSAGGVNIDARAVATNSATTGTLVGLPAQTATGEQLQVALAAHRTATNLKSGTATGYTNRSSGVTLTNVGAFEAATNPVGAVNVTVSPSQEWLAYSFLLTLNYVFDSTAEIDAGPKVATPALVQKHVFAAPAEIDSGPKVATPTLVQKHAVIGTAITSAPVVGTPALGQRHVMTGAAIASAADVTTPALGQRHVVTGTAIASTPVVSNPALGQRHAMTGTAIASTPVVSNPVLGYVYNLSAVAITCTPVVGIPIGSQNPPPIASTPVVGNATIGQRHVLSATAIAASPIVGSPTATQKHVLSATGIYATVDVGSAAFTEFVDLGATGITATPVIDERPTVLIDPMYPLSGTPVPVVGTPSIMQIVELEAVSIAAVPRVSIFDELEIDSIRSVPVMERPQLGWYTQDIAPSPVVGSPIVAQVHVITATGITCDHAMTATTLRQRQALGALGHLVSPVMGNPSAGQRHRLVATPVASTPVVTIPGQGQSHALTAIGGAATPDAPTPPLKQVHVTDTLEIVATPDAGAAVIQQRHRVEPTLITASPVMGNPGSGQAHRVQAVGPIATPVMGNPELAQYVGPRAVGIQASVAVIAPTLIQDYKLTARGISSRAKVTPSPAIGHTNVLTITPIAAVPIVGTPTLRTVHTLSGVSIVATSDVDAATLSGIHHLTCSSIVAWSTVRQSNAFAKILTGQT